MASWGLSVRALGSLGPLRCLAPRPLRTWSGRGRSRCIETLQNQSVQGCTVQKPCLCPRRQSLKLHSLILPLASGLGLQMGQMHARTFCACALWSWNEPENMVKTSRKYYLHLPTCICLPGAANAPKQRKTQAGISTQERKLFKVSQRGHHKALTIQLRLRKME